MQIGPGTHSFHAMAPNCMIVCMWVGDSSRSTNKNVQTNKENAVYIHRVSGVEVIICTMHMRVVFEGPMSVVGGI